MALTQKNVSRGADNYRQIVKVVCCIITCKSDKMVGAKIHFIISISQCCFLFLTYVCATFDAKDKSEDWYDEKKIPKRSVYFIVFYVYHCWMSW